MGNVYFIQAADKVKIGFTRDVAARLAQLQTANGVELRLLAVIENAPRALEQRLHRHFAPIRTQGEWFRFTGSLASLVHHVQRGARPISDAEIKHYASLNHKKAVTDDEKEAQRVLGKACQEVRRTARAAGSVWAEVRAEFISRGGPYPLAVEAFEKRYGKKRDAVH